MSDDPLSLDLIADGFESEWRAGRRPAIDHWVERVPPDARLALAALLIPVEIEYRILAGEQVRPEDYARLGDSCIQMARRALDESPRPSAAGVDPGEWEAGKWNTPGSTERTSETAPIRLRSGGGAAGEDASDRMAGPFRLVRSIGEGGMGAVWLAEQSHPVRRSVAVKLIRADRRDAGEILARFESERQAIALMDHPNIARLLDAGTTRDGVPYFAMELVRGVPATGFCNQHRLGVRQRLMLFADICLAVQHAHQKGIIHRDLKPSNILVEDHNGRFVPKVIDFGLAKATAGDPAGQPDLTSAGGVVGTPLYMAPEQAAGSPDIDTRADVFALGAILFELLTGTTPIPREEARRLSSDELRRRIIDSEPPPPSSRARQRKSDTPPVTAGQEPEWTSHQLRGDLDWIVLRSLARERDRRYGSPGELAADIGRFLRNEPVLAGPPTATYRIRKFVQRHRTAVFAAALVLVALLAGMVATTIAWREAVRQRGLVAEQLLRTQLAESAERSQREQAERNLAFARRANAALGQVFSDVSPDVGHESVALLRSALAENLARLASDLTGEAVGDRLEVAALQDTLASTLTSVGETEKSIGILREAVETRSSLLGADDPLTLSSNYNLANALMNDGQLDEALRLFESTHAAQLRRLGPDDPGTWTTAAGRGNCLMRLGRGVEAVPLMEEVAQRRRDRWGADRAEVLLAQCQLATACRESGDLARAAGILSDTLPRLESSLGRLHPWVLNAANDLAVLFSDLGRPGDAAERHADVFDRRTEVLGPSHPMTLTSGHNLATSWLGQKRFSDAIPLLQRVLEKRRATLGPDHPDTLVTASNLIAALSESGTREDVLRAAEEQASALLGSVGPEHPATLAARANLIVILRGSGQPERALELSRETHAVAVRVLPADMPLRHSIAYTHAVGLLRAGQPAGARDLLEEVVEFRSRMLGEEHAETLNALGLLGSACCATGDGQRGAEMIGRLVTVQRRRLPANSPALAVLLEKVSADLLQGGPADIAVDYLKEGLGIREALDPEGWKTHETRSQLGGALLRAGRAAEAGPILLAAWSGLEAQEDSIPPPARNCLPATLDWLIVYFESRGDSDEAGRFRTLRSQYQDAPVPAVR